MTTISRLNIRLYTHWCQAEAEAMEAELQSKEGTIRSLSQQVLPAYIGCLHFYLYTCCLGNVAVYIDCLHSPVHLPLPLAAQQQRAFECAHCDDQCMFAAERSQGKGDRAGDTLCAQAFAAGAVRPPHTLLPAVFAVLWLAVVGRVSIFVSFHSHNHVHAGVLHHHSPSHSRS